MPRQYFRWTSDRDKCLKTLYQTKTRKEVAKALGTTIGSVNWRIKILGLANSVSAPFRRWKANEINLLKEFYRSTTAYELTKKLNRTVHGIRQKALALGLKSEISPPLPAKDGLSSAMRYHWKNRDRILRKNRCRYRERYNDDMVFREEKKTKSKVYHWTETNRKALLDKHGGKCARCGYSEYESSLCVHHINGVGDRENLILLCMNCHKALHCGLWRLDSLEA